MTAPPPKPPSHTLELIQLLRRVLLFAASQMERWLARYGVAVHKQTRYEDEFDQDC